MSHAGETHTCLDMRHKGPASVPLTTGWWLCHSAKWNQPPGVTCLMPGWSAGQPSCPDCSPGPQAREGRLRRIRRCQSGEETTGKSGHPFLPGLPNTAHAQIHRYSGHWKSLEAIGVEVSKARWQEGFQATGTRGKTVLPLH